MRFCLKHIIWYASPCLLNCGIISVILVYFSFPIPSLKVVGDVWWHCTMIGQWLDSLTYRYIKVWHQPHVFVLWPYSEWTSRLFLFRLFLVWSLYENLLSLALVMYVTKVVCITLWNLRWYGNYSLALSISFSMDLSLECKHLVTWSMIHSWGAMQNSHTMVGGLTIFLNFDLSIFPPPSLLHVVQ